MKKFNLINNITGWIVFLISAVVYLMTIEPTASFWDCGEFITSAFKLQVGHPPGAPFFMLLGRFFTLFAGGDLTLVPVMVNAMSALASAFTILFLYWSITHLARKMAGDPAVYDLSTLVVVIASGVVGALAYTFSDTFWFSAVEGEVYALSSLFTALVFWAILKWENEADQKYANRWLIFIAYLMGLSIGVHLLNLLAIPAIVMVYYFKKYTPTTRGVILAFLLSGAILGVIMYGIIPGVVTVASWFELMFVNGFGLPYKSGVLFYIIGLISLIIWGFRYTSRKGKVLWNTALLAFTVILIGYSSFAMIVIRSNAYTPMNQNNPETLFNLISYLNREQYGDRPLVKGAYYNAPITDNVSGKPTYTQIDGKYVVTNRKVSYSYDERFVTLFPRMHSREPNHVNAYKEWANIKGRPIRVSNPQGEPTVEHKPTFGENLKFLFSYQINYMYFRYFMWNFAGRQNDVQGHGHPTKGNWISGIKFMDEARLGPQDNLPAILANNKARNVYYFLPLLLGLIGLLFHYSKHKKDFWVVMLLFFMTGLAIVLYLNQSPYQPRERDYAYAGSFYAFAIWIGLGVMGIHHFLRKKLPGMLSVGVTTLACLVLVPGIMAKENWDDHDRSGRYTARDFAYNYLNSCAPNAILFTNGDNDTFPLWYAQEVEGIRTDVRVANLSYLGADWYIDQMKHKFYESEALPISMTTEKYRSGNRDVLYIIERFQDHRDLKQVMDYVASDDERTKRIPNYRDKVDHLPTRKVSLPVDSAQIIETGTVRPEKSNLIVPEMRWELSGNYLLKNHMVVLDLLANNNWERPVYYAITVSEDNYLNLQSYFQLQGLAYRIVPIHHEASDIFTGSIDSEIMFDNLVNKFKWGGVNNPKVYLDENNLRMLSNFRNNFSRLAQQLISEGKNDSARIVLDRCLEVMPHETVPYNYFMTFIAEAYYQLGDKEKANEIIDILSASTEGELRYYLRFKGKHAAAIDYEKRLGFYLFNEMIRLSTQHDYPGKADLETTFQELLTSAGPVR